MPKTFYLNLREYNGEQQYEHEYLIYASEIDEARIIAKNHAEGFYDGDATRQGDDTWAFYGCALMVQIRQLHEMPESEFNKRILEHHYLNKPAEEVQQTRKKTSNNVTYHENLLANTIRDCAAKLGIINVNAEPTGPELLILCEDIVTQNTNLLNVINELLLAGKKALEGCCDLIATEEVDALEAAISNAEVK